MPEYLLYFNQQWVGDHPEEWYRDRGPRARAVTEEMKAAGVYVFAGGLEEEDGPVYSADPTSGEVLITDGPYIETKEQLGGFWVIEAADLDEALRIAAEFPWARTGCVEVRPIRDIAQVRERVGAAVESGRAR